MLQFILNIAKKIKPLGFVVLSIYYVTIFFWKGLIEGAITTRASSLAFNFFLAFFPPEPPFVVVKTPGSEDTATGPPANSFKNF